jgi:hypothetical protein
MCRDVAENANVFVAESLLHHHHSELKLGLAPHVCARMRVYAFVYAYVEVEGVLKTARSPAPRHPRTA